MPVFDFSNSPEKAKVSECTYTVFRTNTPFTSPDQPILILDTKEKAFPHHPCGIFTNPSKRTSFEFKDEEETFIADILQIDARFVSLLKWLGENHINVRLSGTQTSDGYAVYKIREIVLLSTSSIIDDGVEAPAVTPAVFTSANHSGRSSLAVSTVTARVCFAATCTSFWVLEE